MSTFSVLLPILAVFGLAAGTCLDNGDKEIGGKCYKFVTQKLSFETARDWCHYQSSVPSYLAYVPDQFTSNFLASYARSSFGTNDGFFWIGLSRSKSYNPWTWDTGYQLSWSNFDGNQLKANFAAENIVNGKWATFDNSTELNFVCSYDPTAPPTFAPPVSTTTGTIPPSTPTTTSVPTTTVSLPPCSKPFHGKIAVAFEMTKLAQSRKVMNFIQRDLFNSTNYQFSNGLTQAINVPYPDSGLYENFILHYKDATSVEILDINIDQLYSEVVSITEAKIERAYEYIYEERDPGNSTTNVLITVGVDDLWADDGSASYYLHRLQLKYGFRSLVVSIGPNWSGLSDLAESPDWYFKATDENSEWIGEQISRIICGL